MFVPAAVTSHDGTAPAESGIKRLEEQRERLKKDEGKAGGDGKWKPDGKPDSDDSKQ